MMCVKLRLRQDGGSASGRFERKKLAPSGHTINPLVARFVTALSLLGISILPCKSRGLLICIDHVALSQVGLCSRKPQPLCYKSSNRVHILLRPMEKRL